MSIILLIDTLDIVLPASSKAIEWVDVRQEPRRPPTTNARRVFSPCPRRVAREGGRQGKDRPMVSDMISPDPVKSLQRFSC